MATDNDSKCPWCGKLLRGVKLGGNGTPMNPHWYAVTCRICGAQGPRRPTPEGAEAAWRERRTEEVQRGYSEGKEAPDAGIGVP